MRACYPVTIGLNALSQLMIVSIVPSFLPENIRLVLSAKLWKIDFENAHCRSLMYRRI